MLDALPRQRRRVAVGTLTEKVVTVVFVGKKRKTNKCRIFSGLIWLPSLDTSKYCRPTGHMIEPVDARLFSA
jgi:hypothetical protein